MIFNIAFDVVNVANRLQISISKETKVGQRIKRENLNELTQDGRGNFIIDHHPLHSALLKSNNNYFVMYGKVKVTHTWDEDSPFQDEHKEIFRNVLHQEINADIIDNIDTSTYKHGEGWMSQEFEQIYRCDKWRPSLSRYEPKCTTSEIEILQNDTVILCPMQHVTGWTFEQIDIKPGETIESPRPGQETYIIFGERCTVQGEDSPEITHVEKFSTKQQTSSNLKIKNEAPNLGKLVRVYK